MVCKDLHHFDSAIKVYLFTSKDYVGCLIKICIDSLITDD